MIDQFSVLGLDDFDICEALASKAAKPETVLFLSLLDVRKLEFQPMRWTKEPNQSKPPTGRRRTRFSGNAWRGRRLLVVFSVAIRKTVSCWKKSLIYHPLKSHGKYSTGKSKSYSTRMYTLITKPPGRAGSFSAPDSTASSIHPLVEKCSSPQGSPRGLHQEAVLVEA